MEHQGSLLAPHAKRSDDDAVRMARAMRAQRVAIKDDLLRGVDVAELLKGGARIFADGGAAAKEDPVGTFALSQPVEDLDYFMSHAWRSPRLAKWMALCCYFNLEAAVAAWLVTCLVCYSINIFAFESLPSYFVTPPQPAVIDNSRLGAVKTAEIFGPVALSAVFFFGHRIFRRRERAFLEYVQPRLQRSPVATPLRSGRVRIPQNSSPTALLASTSSTRRIRPPASAHWERCSTARSAWSYSWTSTTSSACGASSSWLRLRSAARSTVWTSCRCISRCSRARSC